ncbi:peptide-n-(n-acetyl-beta-glucosaminyl) asparagine amidase [Nannochloropsis oceanica]
MCFGPPSSSSSSGGAGGVGAVRSSSSSRTAAPLYSSSSSSSSSSAAAAAAAAATAAAAAAAASSSSSSSQATAAPPRQRVHITRFDADPQGTTTMDEAQQRQQQLAGIAVEGEADDSSMTKPATCLWYELEGTAAAASFFPRPPSPSSELTKKMGAIATPSSSPTRFYYLGGNAEHFLTYLQQELGQTGAAEGEVGRREVEDITQEKEAFASLWREGRLLVADPNTLDMINNKTSFGELLMTYTHRMKRTDDDPLTRDDLLSFLRAEYGEALTADVTFSPSRPPAESMAALKHLLQWFKEGFPYYRSTCLHCGHSGGHAPPSPPPAASTPSAPPVPLPAPLPNDMVGVVAPSPPERAFNATLTEVYRCGACGKIYRFPRSVALRHVLETRRGRCGEYSRLFFKTTEALGYVSRWVVDWEDHVWVEVELPGKGWVHLDPCEAAVDEPLLYEGWGKKQTYILAFSREEVQDVTRGYTTDWEGALGRRTVSGEEMAGLLEGANVVLKGRRGGEVGKDEGGGQTGMTRKKQGGGTEARRSGAGAVVGDAKRSSRSSSSSSSSGGGRKGAPGSANGKQSPAAAATAGSTATAAAAAATLEAPPPAK